MGTDGSQQRKKRKEGKKKNNGEEEEENRGHGEKKAFSKKTKERMKEKMGRHIVVAAKAGLAAGHSRQNNTRNKHA